MCSALTQDAFVYSINSRKVSVSGGGERGGGGVKNDSAFLVVP